MVVKANAFTIGTFLFCSGEKRKKKTKERDFLKNNLTGWRWRAMAGVLPYSSDCKVRKAEFLLGVSCPTG